MVRKAGTASCTRSHLILTILIIISAPTKLQKGRGGEKSVEGARRAAAAGNGAGNGEKCALRRLSPHISAGPVA